MNQELNLIETIRIIIKWKKQLLGAIACSGVVAALFSLLVMDEYYYSWSILYPVNQMQNDRAVIFNTENAGGQIEYFGTKGDVNRLVSIANSAPIREYIIDSFKLVEHYKIDGNSKYFKTKVRKEFEGNYKAIKNEREAVEISIYDTDPKVAANILVAIIQKMDEVNKLTINETKLRLYNLINEQITTQQNRIDLTDDSLASLTTRYNIKVSSGADGTLIVNGSNNKAVQEYKTLLGKQENAVKELNNRINISEQMQVSLKSNASSLFIVDEPFAADRKTKPIRWLVVTITMLITGFVCILGVLMIEQFSNLKKEL
ncbi:MAG: hypothetical protein JNK66_12340 [Chitinophagales bacterium]|nr:hypothetical protein [Chitinophagales bacterium]